MIRGTRGEGVGDMVMVLWFFLLLVLIAGGIALGLRVFFGSGYDIRSVEAAILEGRITHCIETRGAFWEHGGFSECGLSARVLEDVAATNLGVLVCEGNCASGKRVVQTGSNFEACDFIGANKAYSRCSRSTARFGDKSYGVVALSNHEVRRQNA